MARYGEFIELINPYEDGPVTVTIRGVGQLGGPKRAITVTVPAAKDDKLGYWVIGDTSGTFLDPNTGVSTSRTDLPPRAGDRTPNQPENLDLNTGDELTLVNEGGQTIEVCRVTSSGPNDGDQTSQKNDPRVNEWTTEQATPGEDNTTMDFTAAGDKEPSGTDLRDLFFVCNGKLGTVGQLGRVHGGAQWATIDLTGDDVDDHNDGTWLCLYDVFTPDEHAGLGRIGLINVNTAPEEVLKGLEDTKNKRGLNATALHNATHPNSGKGEIIQSIGELGKYLQTTLPVGAQGSDQSWKREQPLAEIAGLVTVRSNMFRVTVRAQALGRQGDADKRSERWLQASVLRTVLPSGEVHVQVLSMRWLTNE